jgi:hypothetical protein
MGQAKSICGLKVNLTPLTVNLDMWYYKRKLPEDQDVGF